MSPVRYELHFSIPEDDILHNYPRENLKSYMLCSLVLNFQMIGEVQTFSGSDTGPH
jgi:hypothetical protein